MSVWDIRRRPRKVNEYKTITFEGFSLGLNSNVDTTLIDQKEMSECVNYFIHPNGQLENRIPLVRYTNTKTSGGSSIITSAEVKIAENTVELIQDANYKLYWITAGVPTYIATLAGIADILSYKGVALVMDGNQLKFSESIGELKLAYDDGLGADGYAFDNDGDFSTGSVIALTNDSIPGGYIRAAHSFTSPSFETGYTVPPTYMSAQLTKIGAPTGNIFAVIRKVSSDATMAKATLGKAQDVNSGTTASVATIYSVNFSAGDITTELSGSTAYYACVEYNLGSTGNEVYVHCTTGATGSAYAYTGSAYNTIADAGPKYALRPGVAPAVKHGVIKQGSPFLFGDSDRPSFLFVGNGTYLDFSTSDGGAKIGLIDDDTNNFPIGGVGVIFNDLYVYGTQAQPCLAQLIGSSPANYSLPLLYQQAWTKQRMLVTTASDLWTTSADGVDPLSGVQEYGDVRTFSASDPIKDRLDDYFSTGGSAVYYPRYGMYLLSFPSYRRVMGARTKQPVQDPATGLNRYPWTEFEFYRENLSHTGTYTWLPSANGTNEFYAVTATTLADPSLDAPDAVTLDRISINSGSVGSLSDHQFDYGDNDGLGFNTIYIRDDSGNPTGTSAMVRTLIIPTSMSVHSGELIIGSSDGYLYKTDSTKYKDRGYIQTDPILITSYLEIPYTEVQIGQIQINSSGYAGAGVTMELFTNGNRVSPTYTNVFNLPPSDGLTKDEWVMDKEDMLFSKDPEQTPKWDYKYVRCRSFRIKLSDVVIPYYPLYHKVILVKYRVLTI